MFKRLTVICLLAATPLPAVAQSVQDQIITQLTAQGFRDFEVSRTLLGRVRIVTKSNTLSREMVFNPTTGEILRDYWEPLSGRSSAPRIFNPSDDDNSDDNDNRSGSKSSSSGSSSGSISSGGSSGGRDDDDRDDDRDEEDEEDEKDENDGDAADSEDEDEDEDEDEEDNDD